MPSNDLSRIATKLDPSRRTRCEVWTRVMGYHRPVSAFNVGKQGEFHERRFFLEPVAERTPVETPCRTLAHGGRSA